MALHACLVLVPVISLFLGSVSGYSSGLVQNVCESMMPQHGFAAQTSSAPYTIIVNTTTFKPGDVISVTLQGNSGAQFKGFLLEARASGSSSSVPLGTFTANPETQLLDCTLSQTTYANSAVSHNSGSSKAKTTVTWQAPEANDVEFRATVVQIKSTFWTQVKSQVIQRSVNTGSTTLGSTTTVTPKSTAFSHSVSMQSMSSTGNNIISSVGCGTTKFCFSNPASCNPASNQNCFFMSSIVVDNQGLKFEMSGNTAGYISIGFSDDRNMGDDDIYICGRNTFGNIQVQRAYSTGRSAPRIVPLGEVYNISVSDTNGVIKCSFITRNSISTTQRASNNMFYLFFAYGSTDGDRIQKHSKLPFISSQKVDVSIPQLTEGTNSKPILIKVHGALMLIAWMTTGSIGMMIAAFFKNVGNRKILGKAVWFQVHLSLMVLTVAATITAFVLPFVHVKGWSYNAGAHPVLGCIVMGLALIQPIVAIWRPSPDHKRRFIFNWFHVLMALVIKVLAVAAIFLGFQLINVAPSRWPVKVMGGFVGWESLIYLLIAGKQYSGRMAIYSNLQKKVELESILLVVYLCGNLAFLIALLVAIGQT
ncbi:putative ferric-chelate reductase 1 [Callorhinchus milii]|uniref:Putative ferric-chelate reductase 1 n=1 Tax=Callorhinchus milii TaxID=7868 RepID=A0A4W3H102_CALMI|nr:putative ferric-chelate reductase 1 [Callorhinchus milii]|eukprot:gi/632940375/ref/XP_007885285.1/ PREDICTED: putative ferric-chelate reductase 1 isoform X2 [Callorhinchus milii]